MEVTVELGYCHYGESLSQKLRLDKYLSIEASTAREVFAQLSLQSPLAQEAFELRFNRWGYLNFQWKVWVNRDELGGRSISSQESLDVALKEGDWIFITSASGQ